MALVDMDSLSPNVEYGAKDVKEIIQNVRTIVSTTKGTCPLDRNFGLTRDLIDSPMSGIRAEAEQEIFLQVRKYEPRAVIKEIIWTTDIMTGEVRPKLRLEIINGVY